jgi:photosystem II stability/assembly factor-like uncharacterized protein
MQTIRQNLYFLNLSISGKKQKQIIKPLLILFLLFISICPTLFSQDFNNQLNDDSLVVKPDYRNHINISEYDLTLMPLDMQANGTGVWTELNPKVPRVDYYSVYFKDKLNGFAVGEFGAIVKTSDGGVTWVDKSYSTSRTLLRISGRENFVVVVGTAGTVLRTTNFGETWESINLQTTVDIWGVYTFNDSVCFVCAKDGILYKTTDGGNNWQSSTIGYPLLYWDMQFMDNDTGYISCSNGKILKTDDAGNNWLIKETGDLYSLYSIEILPNNNLVIAGQSGQIYYSTDYGNTFLLSNVPIYAITEDIAFANNNIGVAIGQATVTNGVLKTIDGGINWNLVNQSMGHLNVDFISDSIGYNVGMALRVKKSTNQGFSWQNKFLIDDFYDSEFITEEMGFVCSGSLYKTINAGDTWVKVPNGVGGYYIDFIDSLIGFVGNNSAGINKTTDGGNNWYSTNYVINGGQIKKIDFFSFNNGYALANSLFKTIDNGETWIQILAIANPNNFYLLDSLNGWVVGYNKIYKTTNGGENWDIINTSYSFNDISFKDNDTGYAVNGQLYKTTDSGFNWQLVEGATGYYLQLVDSTMIIIWGDEGIVFISKDSGVTWQQYNLPSRNSIKFFNKNHGYLVGNTGLIYSYQDTTIVPVEMISFESSISGNQIFLEWRTASELNNNGFEIQKKKNNNDWNSIGFVEGNGTTTDYNNYFFVDTDPISGLNYYRIKQIDYDGTASYSEIRSINFQPINDLIALGNYPNPFNSQTNIVFNIPNDGEVELKVFNILGKEVDKNNYKSLNAGINKINYSMQKLSSGVYFYTIIYNNKRLLCKFMFIK